MIVIDLGSTIVTYALLIALGLLGWVRGFRYMLSIALFITVGYLLTVQGEGFVVGLVNRIWTQLPRLFAFILGRSPQDVALFDPLIPEGLDAPLLFRVLVFVSLLLVGIVKAWPWEGKPMQGFKGGSQPIRILGAATGVYIGVLSISALSTFWRDSGATLNLPPDVITALNALPTFENIIASVIGAFFVLLLVLIILQFPRVWRP
jgi:hypothetical protein